MKLVLIILTLLIIIAVPICMGGVIWGEKEAWRGSVWYALAAFAIEAVELGLALKEIVNM